VVRWSVFSTGLFFQYCSSLSLWIQPRNLDISDYANIFNKGPYLSGDYCSYGLYILPSDTLVHWWEDINRLNYYVNSQMKIYDNQLYHVVCCFNEATFEVSLYLNSKLTEKQFTGGNTPGGNAEVLTVGTAMNGETSSLDSFFDGIIDDFRVYNRALNPLEINALYSEHSYTERVVYDSTEYYVSSLDFESFSPSIYLDSIETIISGSSEVDSLIYHYSKFSYSENYYSDTTFVIDTTEVIVYDTTEVMIYDTTEIIVYDTIEVMVYDTTVVTVYDSISVTDTLIIDVTISGIEPNLLSNRFLVYPNPAKDILYLDMGENYNQLNDWKVKIINISGSIIFETNITAPIYEIMLNDFKQTGMFIIQIIDNQNTIVETRKILLE